MTEDSGRRHSPGQSRNWARWNTEPIPWAKESRKGSSGIIVGRFEAAQQPPQGTLEPHTCTKPPLQRGRTPDRPRLCAFPDCTLAHRATSQTKPRTPCFSSLKAVFSEFYPLNSPNTQFPCLRTSSFRDLARIGILVALLFRFNTLGTLVK